MDGGWRKDDAPHLDLDRTGAGDPQVTALFEAGLRPWAGSGPDLRAIQRRARKRHRRRQAMASGVVTVAAALAVLLVVAPWSVRGQDRGTPARPKPSVTATTVPVSKASLLQPEDLLLPAPNGGPFLGGETFTLEGSAKNLSGRKFHLRVCGEDRRLNVEVPTAGWEQTYLTQAQAEVPAWTITETVVQWPGRPDQAEAVREQLLTVARGCSPAETDGGMIATWTGAANLPTLETAGMNSEGTMYAGDVVVVGDAVVILDVGSWAGDLSQRTSANTFGWLFPAATRVVGGVPGSGTPGPMRLVSGTSASGAGE